MRESLHWLELNRNRHRNKNLQKDYNQFGKNFFRFVVVHFIFDDSTDSYKGKLLEVEQGWIDIFSEAGICYNAQNALPKKKEPKSPRVRKNIKPYKHKPPFESMNDYFKALRKSRRTI